MTKQTTKQPLAEKLREILQQKLKDKESTLSEVLSDFRKQKTLHIDLEKKYLQLQQENKALKEDT